MGPPDDASGPMKPARRRVWAFLPYLLVVAVGAVVLLPKLGDFGLWDPWEPKYAQSGREMIERGSYFVPYYRDKVRLTKPILVYWGVIAGYAAFGINELGARIGGVLLAIGSMCGVLYGVSALRGRRAGLLSALVLGTMPLLYILARQATPDIYVATTLGTSVLFFCVAVFGPDARRTLHFVISYATFALAAMAKGPVIAIPIYFVPMAIFAVARLDLERFWTPELKPETTRALLTGVPAAIALPLFTYTGWLFCLPPDWQGYSERSRAHAAAQADAVMSVAGGLHLTELLLAGIVAVCGWSAFGAFRRSPRGMFGIVTSAILGGASLVALVAAGPTGRLAALSVIGLVAAVVLLVATVRRLASHPELTEPARELLRPVLRQAGLFLGVVAIVAGPWHAIILFAQQHGYFSDFILKHNVGRIADDINSSGPADFYIGVLIFGLFPWCCFLPVALATTVRAWNRETFDRYAFEGYLLVTTAVIFAAFSTAVTKFPYYLAPIVLPAAVLIGLVLDRALEARENVTGRLTAIVALMLYLPPMIDLLQEGNMKYFLGAFTVKRAVADFLHPGPYYHGVLIAFAGFLALFVLFRSRVVVTGLVACGVLAATYITSSFIPAVSQHKSMKQVVESWRDHQQTTEPLGILGSMKHGLQFYTNQGVRYIDSNDELIDLADPEFRIFCLVARRHLKTVKAHFAARYPGHELVLVDDSHLEYVLLANHEVTSKRGTPLPAPAAASEPEDD